jgi:hypothetical protein
LGDSGSMRPDGFAQDDVESGDARARQPHLSNAMLGCNRPTVNDTVSKEK